MLLITFVFSPALLKSKIIFYQKKKKEEILNGELVSGR